MSEVSGSAGAGQPRDFEARHLAWALDDLTDLLARGAIDGQTFARLRTDYHERLRRLTLADPAQVTSPQLGQAAPATVPPAGGVTAARPPSSAGAVLQRPTPGVMGEEQVAAGGTGLAPPPPPAAVRPAEATGALWVNLLLYLGAFFVVMAALIFVSYSWRSLGGMAKATIMLAFTGAFLTAGGACLRVPKVRLAGNTFVAIGALLTPLDIVALYNFVLRDQGLNRASVWAGGSLYCALLYAALALAGLGRVYALTGLLAGISAWGGLLARLDVPDEWVAAAFLAFPLILLVIGRVGEHDERFQRAFGPLPLGVAWLLVPPGTFAALVTMYVADNRTPPAIAFGLALLFYGSLAASEPPGAFQLVTIVAALGEATLFVLAVPYALHAPPRAFPAFLLGLAWLMLVLATLAERRGFTWARLLLAASYIHLVLVLTPWSITVTDAHGAYWAGLYSVALCFVAARFWLARQPWLIYPATLAAGLSLFHGLRAQVGTANPAPFAWGYAALALLLLALVAVARQRGAPRLVDLHPLMASQIVAIVAAALASRSAEQLTILAWLFAAAGAIVVILERRPAFLVLPSLWAVLAAAATLNSFKVEARWAPVAYAGVGLALALGLQAWRAVPEQRRPDWFMAQRWFAGAWAVLGVAVAAVLLVKPAARFLIDWQLLDLVLHRAYGPATLATFLCALAFLGDAVVTMRRPTGYGASAFFATALLMAIARVTPNNPQAYAVPLGLYLLGLSIYVAYERDLGPVRMPAANTLLSSAVVVMLGTTFVQSLAHPLRYILLGLAEGLALLAFTLFLRRRYGVALSLVFLVLTVLRALFDAANTLPNWAVIGFLGLALLGGGLAILLYRDRFDRWVAAAGARWAQLM